jgi:Leucine-rich repeat (LRR) protein
MKKLLIVLLAFPFIGLGQNVNIPDANFKAYLVGNTAINTNGDTEIQVTEANAFTGTIDCSYDNISNLTGIEAFTALTYLYCYDNLLTSLNVSQNTALTQLDCTNNQLTSLDVSGATALELLGCESNQLSSLDVSQNTALTDLYCYSNQLTSLDVSQNTALTRLYCDENKFDCEALKKKYKLE